MSNYDHTHDYTLESTGYCPVCRFIPCECKQPEPLPARYGGEAALKRYQERPPEVKAVKWTGENIDEVRELLAEGFWSASMDLSRNEPTLSIDGLRVHVGKWLAKTPQGIEVLHDTEFNRRFESVEPTVDHMVEDAARDIR